MTRARRWAASIATGGGERKPGILKSYEAGSPGGRSVCQIPSFPGSRAVRWVKSYSVRCLQYLLDLGMLKNKFPQPVIVICIGMRECAT